MIHYPRTGWRLFGARAVLAVLLLVLFVPVTLATFLVGTLELFQPIQQLKNGWQRTKRQVQDIPKMWKELRTGPETPEQRLARLFGPFTDATVVCDATTNTEEDRKAGRVRAEVKLYLRGELPRNPQNPENHV